MFGLEDKKKKPDEKFFFELEKELKDPKRYKELHQHIEERVQKLKDFLRNGDNQEGFERFVLLLQGYQALLKVMARLVPKVK